MVAATARWRHATSALNWRCASALNTRTEHPTNTVSRQLTPLPIDSALPELLAALQQRAVAVLEAPPGAGKTTRVPLALLDTSWLGTQRIVMLEPRRLAARAAATYMARQCGESVGGTVGYRVRGETRVSARTRIEVVTEGVLARLLSADATLDGYGAVIFDEFHERSLHADLGLALVLETQQQLRAELRVLVMSATLDGDAVAALIADAGGAAPVVRSAGRMFPVTTHHRASRADERVEATTSRVIREALQDTEGDVLVFLPGAGEQRRVAERLQGGQDLARVHVHVLHGSMPLAEQDAALAPAPSGWRKVVLSTSIAETSLTVEGVRVVIDVGLSRIPRFDAAAGLTRLHTVRVSRASADQRRGRAGRTAPGSCYRLWDVHEEHVMPAATRPEIVDADLSSLALELADAGIGDPLQLRWLDAPKAAPFAAARALLTQLGALDAQGRITPHGKRMASMPLAPRLAHLLLMAATRGETMAGAAIAALLEERDVLRADGGRPPADLRLRTELLRRDGDGGTSAGLFGASVDRDATRRARQSMQDLLRRGDFGAVDAKAPWSDDDIGALLALAFPDRVAQRRSGPEPRYLMRNGSGAILEKRDGLHDAPWLAIAELEGQPPEYRIVRAAPITLEEITADFSEQYVREPRAWWDDTTRSVRATLRTTLGALVLEEKPWRDVAADTVRAALITHLQRIGVDAWPWSDGATRLRERLMFLHRQDVSWPDVSDDALLVSLEEWLGPFLENVRNWSQLESLDWHEALASLVPWSQRAALDRLAPTHIEVPSGSRIAVDYHDTEAPVLAVKLQECFGWTTTPTLFDGRVPLTMHLLSPAQRPVQVTRDLAGFWKGSYFEVRKELRGRYPRHPWPDDPLTAVPTRRAKPRGQ
ncbi:MAG TPA: ATP-dependent helicase HrpB [Gemmatimonas aurantiaca]|uniref:ATP-dependent helicase HrpB n=1 Tax=Gemmatimonas aurantiaca TaxID=173480 RepID=A0A3D4VEA9_9BACT|nr:ATP-dependent helicase HrpB [Gemmatimonas aurantiaca]